LGWMKGGVEGGVPGHGSSTVAGLASCQGLFRSNKCPGRDMQRALDEAVRNPRNWNWKELDRHMRLAFLHGMALDVQINTRVYPAIY
jgi:hypothetical protein